MSSKSFKVSREELERMIQICENVEKRGLDPFTVNVRALLEKLRRLLEEGGDLEHYILDAETMYRIAALIALQHRWLRERAQSLFIDAQMVQTRLMALDSKSIVRAFLKAWRPIISLEQITIHRLRQGVEHFLSLPPRAGSRSLGWKVSQREVEHARGSLELEEELSEKLKQLHHELIQRYELEGEMDYWEFVRGKSFEEMFERAYLLSFLITNGYVDVRRNPLKSEIRLVPAREKSERKRPASLVITLRSWGEHE
jgi:hypothetical protein